MHFVWLIAFYYITLFERLKKILLIKGEKNSKNLAKSMRVTLAIFFVCIAHVLWIPFNNEKRNPKKLNFAYSIVNLSKK